MNILFDGIFYMTTSCSGESIDCVYIKGTLGRLTTLNIISLLIHLKNGRDIFNGRGLPMYGPFFILFGVHRVFHEQFIG